MEQIELGKLPGGKTLFWNPEKEKNPHFLVVGTSGAGKTETVKAVVLELKRQGIPSLIFDFHDDFSELGDAVIDVSQESFNLLLPAIGQRPRDVSFQVADIIAKVYSLGIIQQSVVRDAIQTAYLNKGIPLDEKTDLRIDFPTFSDVKDIIWHSDTKEAEKIRARCADIFQLRVFSNVEGELSFQELLKKTVVIDLHDFPTEDSKVAVSEFFLNRLIYEFYKIGKSHTLRGYLVVDEAHRLTYDESPVDKLLRESRKYGYGVVLSSQRPSDFSQTTLANVGSALALQCNLVEDAKAIGNHIGAPYHEIKSLNQSGLGFFWTTSRSVPEKIMIRPISERLTEKEKQDISSKHSKRMALITKEQKDLFQRALALERKSKDVQTRYDETMSVLENKKKELAALTQKLKATDETKSRLLDENQEYKQKITTIDKSLERLKFENDQLTEKLSSLKSIEKELDITKRKLSDAEVELEKRKQPWEREEASTENKCKKCHKINDADAAFCTNCGVRF